MLALIYFIRVKTWSSNSY